jgi:hypothetical protein
MARKVTRGLIPTPFVILFDFCFHIENERSLVVAETTSLKTERLICPVPAPARKNAARAPDRP